MKSRAPATRPVYRVKAQPANEGGYAVLRGAQVVFDDLHRTLASALAHDLNAAVGSGRTYRCGPQSVRWSECKILASDGTKVKTPRLYVGEALAVAKELNRAAAEEQRAMRENGAKWRTTSHKARKETPVIKWRWVDSLGVDQEDFFLPSRVVDSDSMAKNYDEVRRKVLIASGYIAPLGRSLRAMVRRATGRPARSVRPTEMSVLFLPKMTALPSGVVTRWTMLVNGESVGDFRMVSAPMAGPRRVFEQGHRSNPGRWFDGGSDMVLRMPSLSRVDYRRLHAFAVRHVGDGTDAGTDIRLSVGSVFAAPDGEGGVSLWFSADPRRSGVYYELSASTLKRRAAAE